MSTLSNILFQVKKVQVYICVSVIFCFFSLITNGQPPPPRPIAVYNNPAQGLIFGAFFNGASGGTVMVNHDGTRNVTGSLVQANLGFPFSPAVFEVEANPGTVVSIMNGPDVTLSGSNGGTLTLHLDNANTGPLFISAVAPPARTQVRIGGTLTVGSPIANPRGNYTGSFSITFIQQ